MTTKKYLYAKKGISLDIDAWEILTKWKKVLKKLFPDKPMGFSEVIRQLDKQQAWSTFLEGITYLDK